MHPCALSDVTHSAFCPQRLRDLYELICPVWVFRISKHVERLVQRNFEQRGLFITSGEFSVLYSLPKVLPRHFEASREGVGFGPTSQVHACVSRVDFSRVERRLGCRLSRISFGLV